jgi:MoaA/NifB/PqqE/SkfB family radical SAM enzyme
MNETRPLATPLKRLTVGLTNLCNLDCDYCLKVAETQHLDYDLLSNILAQAKEAGVTSVTYTGGEVSLHPRFRDIIHRTTELGFNYSMVTNGWHFPRIAPVLAETKQAIYRLFFSMDGATEEDHDAVRGKGSFRKIMSAVSLCRIHGFPFGLQMVVTRRSVKSIERLAVFGARLGADVVNFAHMLPTSEDFDAILSLTPEERRAAEREVLAMDNILNIRVTFAAGSYAPEPGPPCVALAGETVNVDCRGRLTLCCNLSDFRNAVGTGDIVADLRETSFADAYEKCYDSAVRQRELRDAALKANNAEAEFPCHFCISTFDKTSWETPLVQIGRLGR